MLGTLFLTTSADRRRLRLLLRAGLRRRNSWSPSTSAVCADGDRRPAPGRAARRAPRSGTYAKGLLLRRWGVCRDRAEGPGLPGAYPQIYRPRHRPKVSFRPTASVGAACAHRRAPSPPPPFPRELEWVNVAPLRMDKQRGRPVLVEFWDFCRVNSLRTLPYLIGVARALRRGRPARDRHPHRRLRCPRATPTRCAAAVARLGHRVPGGDRRAARAVGLLRQRGLAGALPVGPGGRALLDALRRGRLRGDRARDPGAARRRARARAAACGPRTPRACCCRRRPPTSPAPTRARTRRAAVWAVLEGAGDGARRTGARSRSTGPAPTRSIEHERHTRGELALEVGAGVTCHATCFTPALP